MDPIESILSLQSVRQFESKEIPNEILDRILEASSHTPSAENIQPWHFVVVSDRKLKEELAKGQAKFIADSAVTIIGCGDPQASPAWYKVEAGAAMQTMVLAAWVQGIGSCWVDFSHTERKIHEILNIPERLEIIAMVAFGYPAGIPKKKAWKKPPDEIIHYNKF